MAITKAKKGEILEKIRGVLGKATVVFVNFHGLTVSEATEMRRALTAQGIGYSVAKKSLIKKALGESERAGELPELSGELALAYGDDQIAPARGIHAFMKKFPEKLAILGGLFEGAYVGKDAMTGIATIPAREVLYGQFANLINSPIQRFVIALSEVAKQKGA